MRFKRFAAASVFALAGLHGVGAHAQQAAVALHMPTASAKPARPSNPWAARFATFAKADQERAPVAGGVLFVGSSSIRLWDDLETQFSDWPGVLERGFGGSRMLDCVTYLKQLVTPYKPRLVLVYAGDNDLAEGRTPDEVLHSFRAFVQGVRAELPDTRIAYISIKPSPSRQMLLPQIRATNALIESYVASADNIDFIDIFTPMLDADDRPKSELFREDALHLNAAGYALWKSVISAHLQ